MSDLDLARSTQAILAARCAACHSSTGQALKGVVVDDHRRLVGAGRAVVPGSQDSLLLRMVRSGAMPASGERLTEAEVRTLVEWVARGAPEWRPQAEARRLEPITEAQVARFIEDDLLRAPQPERRRLRYFVLTHLDNLAVDESELERHRQALAKLLNSLSWQSVISQPVPIDVRGMVLRISLPDFGWNEHTWNRIVQFYPYAILRPEHRRIEQLAGASVAYLRADWFVATASMPPLYYDILRLPHRLDELERMLGVDADRNVNHDGAVRAGIRTSGVSRNNRALERHQARNGAYWKSYDFTSSTGSENIFQKPLRLEPAGGEMIFSLPNGMQGYYLVSGRGERIDQAPTEIVFDRSDPTRAEIVAGRSCMSCHFEGIKTFRDDMRPVLLQSTRLHGRDKALALYAEQSVLDELVERDAARFRRALVEAGGEVSADPRSEVLGAVARRFEAAIGVDLAAAELGLPPARLQSFLQGNSRLLSLGFAQLLVENGSVKRDLWEEQFPEVVRGCSLGQPHPGSLAAGRTPALARVAGVLLGESPERSGRFRGAGRRQGVNQGVVVETLLGAIGGAAMAARHGGNGKSAAVGAAAGAASALVRARLGRR